MPLSNIYNFLIKLSENNNREWYHANKELYYKAKTDFELFIDNIIPKIIHIDKQIMPMRAKDCIFRIFRDTRFSKDKTPYKTNMGAFIANGGRKGGNPGYYIHIEPGASMAAGGMYMPPSDKLKAIRNEIYNFPEDLKTIILNKRFVETFGEIYGEKLKTAPKGFPKDFPDIELLRFKSYTVFESLSDEDILNENIENKILGVFEVMKPFNQFLNRALIHN